MNRFPFEPTVRVGLCEDSPFGLNPVGLYNVDSSEEQMAFNPLFEDSYMEVKGVTIGKDFHWQQHRDLKYHGSILLRRHAGHSSLINMIKAEEYLKSVVSSEMSPDAPLEYLKAHAIISRSWLLRALSHPPKGVITEHQTPGRIITFTQNDAHTGFDVCADDHCQRYQGIGSQNAAAEEAIRCTRGMVLTDSSGEIADARFSKCCGGSTERFSSSWQDIHLPYLTPVECPYCNPHNLTPAELDALARCMKDYDASTPYFEWTEVVPASLISTNLKNQHGIDIGEILHLKPVVTGPSGRIVELQIIGEKGEVTIGKELAIRRLLSHSHLYSSAFSITNVGRQFELHGRGWGHGVGLCQTGAAVMALRGFSASDILSLYYPGTKTDTLYD